MSDLFILVNIHSTSNWWLSFNGALKRQINDGSTRFYSGLIALYDIYIYLYIKEIYLNKCYTVCDSNKTLLTSGIASFVEGQCCPVMIVVVEWTSF